MPEHPTLPDRLTADVWTAATNWRSATVELSAEQAAYLVTLSRLRLERDPLVLELLAGALGGTVADVRNLRLERRVDVRSVNRP